MNSSAYFPDAGGNLMVTCLSESLQNRVVVHDFFLQIGGKPFELTGE